MNTEPLSRPARAVDLVTALSEQSITCRLFGGTAINHQCPSARYEPQLQRDYSDIDLVVSRSHASRLESAAAAVDLQAADHFNALHGHSRMLFTDRDGSHVDVFVATFVMCHRLELEDRLLVAPITLAPADLLLTKLQVADVTFKDVQDSAALLLDHDLTEDDSGIALPYVAQLLASDWGWWRTVTENLGRLAGRIEPVVQRDEERVRISERLQALSEAIAEAPKSLRWKMRARIGDRLPWRDDPEET